MRPADRSLSRPPMAVLHLAGLLVGAGVACASIGQTTCVNGVPGDTCTPQVPFTWADVTPAVSPSARWEPAMVYDSARGLVVLFGGQGIGYQIFTDTWEWDGIAWRNVTPAVNPPARYGHALAYDSARERVVLFGGGGASGGFLADTWEWDGSTWRNVTPAVSPPARAWHTLAYDSARGRVVLFGGQVGPLADTWEWDGITWRNVTPAVSPPARELHAMAYDSARGRVVLFGGSRRYSSGPFLADTWEWDGITWRDVTPAVNPPARYEHALAYDSARGRVVLFGGAGGNGGVLADTWEWDGAAWSDVTQAVSPPGRAYHGMTYDGARGRVVLFGGNDVGGTPSDSYLADTWEWEGGAAEVCNGIDDDCDGLSDEDLGTTTCGIGACRVTGQNCVGGVPQTCTPGTPAAELCNGIDDDCDGSIDDGVGPGTVGVSLEPTRLWPPNHRMVDIHATVTLSGGCLSDCPTLPVVLLTSATSNEPDDAIGVGDGHTLGDIQDASIGSSDFDLRVRAERDGSGDGRLYQVTYTVTDCFGQTASGYGGVFVPHDEGGKTEPLVMDVVPRSSAGGGGDALKLSPIAGATGYNVVRGHIASIRTVGSFTVIENAVCMASGMVTTSISGALMDENPAPGQVFFYLAEYIKGGPSGYGTEAGGREVTISSGDSCH